MDHYTKILIFIALAAVYLPIFLWCLGILKATVVAFKELDVVRAKTNVYDAEGDVLLFQGETATVVHVVSDDVIMLETDDCVDFTCDIDSLELCWRAEL